MQNPVSERSQRTILAFCLLIFFMELLMMKPNENVAHREAYSKPHNVRELLPSVLSGEWSQSFAPQRNHNVSSSTSLFVKEDMTETSSMQPPSAVVYWNWWNHSGHIADPIDLSPQQQQSTIQEEPNTTLFLNVNHGIVVRKQNQSLLKSSYEWEKLEWRLTTRNTTTTTTTAVAAAVAVSKASKGFWTLFPKNFIRTEGNTMWPASNDKASVAAIKAEYLVGLHLFWKMGAALTSPVSLLKLQGGLVAPGVWSLLGSVQPFHAGSRGVKISEAAGKNMSHLLKWFGNGQARMLTGHEAYRVFGELLLHRQQEDARRNKTSSELSVTDESCFWYGQLRYTPPTQRPSTATTPLSSHQLTLLSTCGHAVTLKGSDTAYDAFTGAIRWVLVLSGVLPIVMACAGLVLQAKKMNQSRAVTLRCARAQYLVIGSWMALYVFIAQLMWNMFPPLRKLTNLIYLAAMFGSIISFAVFHVVDHEYRAANNQPRNTRTLLALAGLLILVNLLPIFLETQMFSAPILYLGALTYWMPQLVHAWFHGGLNAMSPWAILGSTMLPVNCFIGVGIIAGTYPVEGSVQQVSVVWPIVIVVVEAVVLFVANRFGLNEIVPRWMRPWRHRYDKLPRPEGREEEAAECTICTERLFPQPSTTASATTTNEDAVWVTPCHHLFHAACLGQWMEQQMLCPLCRKVLPPP